MIGAQLTNNGNGSGGYGGTFSFDFHLNGALKGFDFDSPLDGSPAFYQPCTLQSGQAFLNINNQGGGTVGNIAVRIYKFTPSSSVTVLVGTCSIGPDVNYIAFPLVITGPVNFDNGDVVQMYLVSLSQEGSDNIAQNLAVTLYFSVP